MRTSALLLLLATPLISIFPALAERPSLPQLSVPLSTTANSHPFSGAAYQKEPLDLDARGYVEEEFLMDGHARVFGWPKDWTPGRPLAVEAEGPYVARLLIRRPRDLSRWNGAVVVEPFNPSLAVDLPIMWAQSHEYFVRKGYAWVGITAKPTTFDALRRFDPARYGRVSMANPRPSPCTLAQMHGLNAFSGQLTSDKDETGLLWDMLSQLGMLLKSTNSANPLGHPARYLYMTGQSQSASYARTYASVFSRITEGLDGKPLYDGYLYSGGGTQTPLNQCLTDALPGADQGHLPAGVPVIDVATQGDTYQRPKSRRNDSDSAPDLFRRYEVAGAAHAVPYERRSFANDADMAKAGRFSRTSTSRCLPDAPLGDFPIRYFFNGAWENLDRWVREGKPAPHAPRLALITTDIPGPSDRSERAFKQDAQGNALAGVRSPMVDVPTARWVGARSGGYGCWMSGYELPFDRAKLASLYPTHADYVAKVEHSVDELVRQRWLTAEDGRAIVADAQRAAVH